MRPRHTSRIRPQLRHVPPRNSMNVTCLHRGGPEDEEVLHALNELRAKDTPPETRLAAIEWITEILTRLDHDNAMLVARSWIQHATPGEVALLMVYLAQENRCPSCGSPHLDCRYCG